MKQNTEGNESVSKIKDTLKTRSPGWATMPSTSAFRAINFELFVKPNKYVMAVGATTFMLCVGYLVYMNVIEEKKKTTYMALNEDGSLSSRPKVSKWD